MLESSDDELDAAELDVIMCHIPDSNQIIVFAPKNDEKLEYLVARNLRRECPFKLPYGIKHAKLQSDPLLIHKRMLIACIITSVSRSNWTAKKCSAMQTFSNVLPQLNPDQDRSQGASSTPTRESTSIYQKYDCMIKVETNSPQIQKQFLSQAFCLKRWIPLFCYTAIQRMCDTPHSSAPTTRPRLYAYGSDLSSNLASAKRSPPTSICPP